MELAVRRAAPWAVAACALVMLLRGLLAQVALQGDLNAAMQGVLRNVAEAGELTEETAQAMAPLASTARTLESMNRRLGAIGQELGAINGALERVTAGQGRMLAHIDSLNNRTSGVVDALVTIDAQNRAMLETNRNLASQTEIQAGDLERLSVLTEHSIGYLGLLNHRLAFLR